MKIRSNRTQWWWSEISEMIRTWNHENQLSFFWAWFDLKMCWVQINFDSRASATRTMVCRVGYASLILRWTIRSMQNIRPLYLPIDRGQSGQTKKTRCYRLREFPMDTFFDSSQRWVTKSNFWKNWMFSIEFNADAHFLQSLAKAQQKKIRAMKTAQLIILSEH